MVNKLFSSQIHVHLEVVTVKVKIGPILEEMFVDKFV